MNTAPDTIPEHKPLRVLYITHYNLLNGGANLSMFNLMLDLKKRYGVIPSVLMPGEGELADRCRENGIEVFCTKFKMWLGENSFISKAKGIVKLLLNRIYYFRKMQPYSSINTSTSFT